MQEASVKQSLVKITKLLVCWLGCFGVLLFIQLSHAEAALPTSGNKPLTDSTSSSEQMKPALSAHKTLLMAIDKLNELAAVYEKKKGQSEKAIFREEARKVLEPLIGFKIFARRTMDKYYKTASLEQRREFLAVSKQVLLKSYADSLLAIRDYQITVLPPPANNKNSLKSTRVYMHIETPGKQRVSVIQSMYFSKQQQSWKVKNVKVAGINIGMVLRESFNRLVAESSGDLDLAIIQWGKALAKL